MRRFVYFGAAVLAVNVFMMGLAVGADLPKSGSFKIHSGWKAVGEVTKVADNHLYGAGNFWGVTYNDAGSGLLHQGGVVCPYTLDSLAGAGTAQGTCAWGDSDGDRIFTSWSGSFTPAGVLNGMNDVTGGTGKFVGVRGKAPFQCQALNADNQWTCTQQFEYRLP